MEVFLKSLFETGQPVLTPGDIKPEKWIEQTVQRDSESLISYLKSLHAALLLKLPGQPLAFHQDAALWGARMVFTLCATTVFREIEPQELLAWLSQTMPFPTSPEAHLSADISLCYLPDIHELVCRIADGDPLLSFIDQLALSVPLSSIGMKLPKQPDLITISNHQGLNQLHAERVIAHSDQQRATIPSVAKTIHTLVGSYESTLSPDLTLTSS